MIIHTTAFDIPVAEHWLERPITPCSNALTTKLHLALFLYGEEVTITEFSALRFRLIFCYLIGKGEITRIMPFVFTTAMKSEFPGVGVGPGVLDLVARSVVSPFSELDTMLG